MRAATGPGAPVRPKTPLRTVFDTRTQQHAEVPLTEFQLLLRYGRIQETFSEDQDGRRRYAYCLV